MIEYPADLRTSTAWAALAMLQNKPACVVFCRRTRLVLGLGGKLFRSRLY